MAAAFIFKIGALAMKTLAKPLSNRFQAYIMSHPIARKYTIQAAQHLHRFEVWVTRTSEGKTGRAFVGQMNEDKSIELASKLASESFVFLVGAAIVAFEVERQRRKDLVKKSQEAAERQALLQGAKEERERLTQENKQQQELIHQLLSRVDKLEEANQAIQRALNEAQQTKSKSNNWFGGFLGPRALL